MQKPKGCEGRFVQRLPIRAHGLQQAHGAHHIGLDEVFGAVDGAIHMALGRKIKHGTRLVLGQ